MPESDTSKATCSRMTFNALRIAVLVPCLDEEASVAQVVSDFRAALPGALVYVYDNGSSDGTVREARKAGAVVRVERRRGKGHVVRRMFADVEADIYVLVDGDDTYEARAVPAMVELLKRDHLDMVTGVRVADQQSAYRHGHRFGNAMLTGLISTIFGADLKDMLSGYRVLSRRLVKSFPVASRGFEVETELTVHAFELSMPMAEVETRYAPRPENSVSKLKTYSDGFRILMTIWRLLQQERPAAVYGSLGGAALLLALGVTAPVLIEYFQTGFVPRFPTLIAAGSVAVCGVLSIAAGAIVSAITQGRREIRRLFYLQQSGPGDETGGVGDD